MVSLAMEFSAPELLKMQRKQAVRFADEICYIAARPGMPNQAKPIRKGLLFIKALGLVTLLYLWWTYTFAWIEMVQRSVKPSTDNLWDYDDIIPSERLLWYPCFSHEPAIKCARLTVPMDYNRPLNASADNPKVNVALLLVPGKHSESKKFSTSPLLLNPGGPGGSGVLYALGLGSALQLIVGEEQDIIGFDPRGIGATTPRTDWYAHPVGWPGSQSEDPSTGGGEDYAKGNFHRLLWQTAGREAGIVNSSSGSLKILDSRAKAQAKLCQEKDSVLGKDSIFKYVSTPNVVKDMVSIIDAWDEWTESQSCAMEASEVTSNIIDPSLDTKGKLVYWGFSYGSILGATFGSMFPERVGRVILDGVVDADLYVSPVWMDSVRDADAIFASFPKYCHEGREACALYHAGDELEDVEERFYGTIAHLKENPIILVDPSSYTPIIIRYELLQTLFFGILYAPVYGFSTLAMILDLVLKDQFQLIANIFSITVPFEAYPPRGESRPAWMYPNEAQTSIMCSDKRYPLNESLPDLQERFETVANTSVFADVWLTVMLGCEGWGIEAKGPPMRWDDHPAHKQKPINTSFPVLFISNTYDPVTPLRAGVDMAKRFVDAGLIEQKSMGHCSIAAISFCTISKIKAYLTKGEVPPPPKHGTDLENGEWDRCEADEWPFHPYPYIGTESVSSTDLDVEKAEAIHAYKQMQDVFAEMKHWGQPQMPDFSSLISI